MTLKLIRDILVVARHELADAVKSRRAAVVLILYLAAAMLTCNGFISALHKIEMQLSKALGLPAASTPGTVMNVLWKSDTFRKMMKGLIGSQDVVDQLMSVHPMALVYGWLVFLFTPVLVVLAASPRISEELGSGSIKFVLLRTSRPAWCVGKFIGQALMTIVALTISAFGAWCLMRWRLAGMEGAGVAQGMVVYSWKAWLYSLSFLGLALGVSQLTRSANKAMALGFGVWMGVSVLGVASSHLMRGGWEPLWQAVHMLVPLGHRLDLWRTDVAHVVQSGAFLVALGFVYMFAGHAFLARRDL
jgi:ABC-type transport system involved in multi-copper enzyme maturation permease subunit